MIPRRSLAGLTSQPTDTPFVSGAPVLDRDDPDPGEGIVIHTPDESIENWTVDIDGEEMTVAESNPEYDPNEPVVLIAFESLLDEFWPEWADASIHELFDGVCEHGVKFYSFPASRLKRDPDRPTVAQRDSDTDTDTDEAEATDEREAEKEMDGAETVPESPDEQVRETGQERDHEPVQMDDRGETRSTWEPPAWLTDLRDQLAAKATVEFDSEREALRVEKLGETYYVHKDGSIDGGSSLRSQLASRVEEIRNTE